MSIGCLHTGAQLLQLSATTIMSNYICYRIEIPIIIIISSILVLNMFISLFSIIIINSHTCMYTISCNSYYISASSSSTPDHASLATLYMIFNILLTLDNAKQLNCIHVNIQIEVIYCSEPYHTKIRNGL